MDKRIPNSLTYLLSKYYQLLEKEFGGSIHGVYIYGSIATGSYDDEKSDIDFMAVINGELTDERIERIKSVHKNLASIAPDALKMEGEYVNRYDLEQGRFDNKYPYIADGRFQEFVHLKYMTLFQVKEFGITLYGEEFSSIKCDISWKKVEEELKERLQGYW
ncbi:MAG TPA: nucleotidyltransferase domain-containing protein, partial [Clostridia bacterium]|nr:nucleotidyltransferase domain-containing protein [Clostridia bacterium]